MQNYLKGKDIKTKGDCLVYCYTRRIEVIIESWPWNVRSEKDKIFTSYPENKPEGFEKW